MVTKECGRSGDRTVKLTVFEKWTDGTGWCFPCWYRFSKIKSWTKIFGVVMIKNRCGQSGHGILKLTVSKKRTDGINWFFACWYNSGKLKVKSIIFGWTRSKIAMAFYLVYETLKSAYLKNEFINFADILNANILMQ